MKYLLAIVMIMVAVLMLTLAEVAK